MKTARDRPGDEGHSARAGEGYDMGIIVDGQFHEIQPPHREVTIEGAIYRPAAPSRITEIPSGPVTLSPNGDGFFTVQTPPPVVLPLSNSFVPIDGKPRSVVTDGTGGTSSVRALSRIWR
jgi:hypothetical protein